MRHETDPWASDKLYLSFTDLVHLINGQTLEGIGLRIEIEPDDRNISISVLRQLIDCNLLASNPKGLKTRKEEA